jgi:hypothetical protein
LADFPKKGIIARAKKTKKNKKFGRIPAFLAPSFFVGRKIEAYINKI